MPGAGVDIEAEGKKNGGNRFVDYTFPDNAGSGAAAASGDTEDISFTNCGSSAPRPGPLGRTSRGCDSSHAGSRAPFAGPRGAPTGAAPSSPATRTFTARRLLGEVLLNGKLFARTHF